MKKLRAMWSCLVEKDWWRITVGFLCSGMFCLFYLFLPPYDIKYGTRGLNLIPWLLLIVVVFSSLIYFLGWYGLVLFLIIWYLIFYFLAKKEHQTVNKADSFSGEFLEIYYFIF